MDYLIVPLFALVGALLIRSQKLQHDITAMKTQNERIIAAVEIIVGDPMSASDICRPSDNKGEDTQ